jgi:hypothetical protein
MGYPLSSKGTVESEDAGTLSTSLLSDRFVHGELPQREQTVWFVIRSNGAAALLSIEEAEEELGGVPMDGGCVVAALLSIEKAEKELGGVPMDGR